MTIVDKNQISDSLKSIQDAKNEINVCLKSLQAATAQCTGEDLHRLNRDGTLPNGIYNYLIACRVKVS